VSAMSLSWRSGGAISPYHWACIGHGPAAPQACRVIRYRRIRRPSKIGHRKHFATGLSTD